VITDPFGHVWSIATHKEDVDPADMPRRMEEAMKKQQH
jgi:PhnB protein